MPKLTKRKASNLLNLGKWVKKRRVNEGDKESHKNDKKKENVTHFSSSIYLSRNGSLLQARRCESVLTISPAKFDLELDSRNPIDPKLITSASAMSVVTISHIT